MSRKGYILYDERANYDEDKAQVLCCADSLREARRDKKDMSEFNPVIFEYDIIDNQYVNGRKVE